MTTPLHRCLAALSLGSLLLCGCAFNVVYLTQRPATFTALSQEAKSFTLVAPAKVKVGTPFPVYLRDGTHWTQVGTTELGEVYNTKDQVLAVEGSNMHEAFLVVDGDQVVGFLLKVEKTFSSASQPVRIKIQKP
ncbi:MAG: hypothetical protein IPL39_14900 [Opitutaceae bacterium]|nr:hypothetical protein [Opitutaceae bacterium]